MFSNTGTIYALSLNPSAEGAHALKYKKQQETIPISTHTHESALTINTTGLKIYPTPQKIGQKLAKNGQKGGPQASTKKEREL